MKILGKNACGVCTERQFRSPIPVAGMNGDTGPVICVLSAALIFFLFFKDFLLDDMDSWV